MTFGSSTHASTVVEPGVTLDLDKCQFSTDRVKF